MAHKDATLTVETKDVLFIKPLKPTPTPNLSLSTVDNLPENNFLSQSLHIYQSASINSLNSTKLDPAKVIKEALSKALFYYYPLAGRLVRHADGKLRINCTTEGVPFMEATCHCDLSSLHYLDGNDIAVAKHFGVNFPSEDELGNQYPLVFKVTKFLCGGFAFAVGWSHAVCDGTGISLLLGAIAELASGKSEPSVKPVWERERLVGTITPHPMQNPLDNSSLAISPFLPTTEFSHEFSKVDKECITRLKTSLMKESYNEQCINNINKGFTTFETLAAFIWRSRTRALKLNYDGETMLIIIVGVRQRLLHPLPRGYYGNAIVRSYVRLTVRELNEKPLFEVVKLIRESIKASLKNDYIIHSIDSEVTNPMKFNYKSGAITIVTDWRQLVLAEKVDFGWKEPVNTVPVPDAVYGYSGLCNIVPTSNLDPCSSGGARVYASLPRDAMPKFKQEMEALHSIQSDA